MVAAETDVSRAVFYVIEVQHTSPIYIIPKDANAGYLCRVRSKIRHVIIRGTGKNSTSSKILGEFIHISALGHKIDKIAVDPNFESSQWK